MENLPSNTNPPAMTPDKFALAMVPFSPYGFNGPDSIYAWGRLLLYGAGAALTWKSQKQISYVLIGAAGVSLLTSLASSAKDGKK